MCPLFVTTKTMTTSFGRDFFGSETPPNVSVVTDLDTFKPSSKMLISSWLASTVLNSGTHVKNKCYGYTLRVLQDFSPSRCSVTNCFLGDYGPSCLEMIDKILPCSSGLIPHRSHDH